MEVRELVHSPFVTFDPDSSVEYICLGFVIWELLFFFFFFKSFGLLNMLSVEKWPQMNDFEHSRTTTVTVRWLALIQTM